MKFFALFIYRPVATILLSVAITLCGVLGFRLLPVAPLPQVDFPVIMVSASRRLSTCCLTVWPCGRKAASRNVKRRRK